MSNLRLQTRSVFKAAFVVALALLVVAPASPTQAFQVRHADSLRVMQSKPYAASASFRVNADMFIQPSAKIRSDELVGQPTPPPTTSTTTLTTTQESSGGGGSSFGGARYSSDWYLSRKYDELVRERDEADTPFLTSAPEDPTRKFDYVPTRPDEIEYIDEPTAPEPLPKAEAPTSIVTAPNQASVLSPIITSLYEPSAEDVLVSSPVDENPTVVRLTSRQKNSLLKAHDEGFTWPWSKKDLALTEVEPWHASAPNGVSGTGCVGCQDVLWWTWCVFVVIALTLILIFVILIFALQILILRLRADRHKPDNPRTLKYRMKKFLQQFGLLALVLCALNVTAFAQTTTPQTLIYEGELLDDVGDPVAGSYDFRFSFWDNGDFEAGDVLGSGALNVGAGDYRGWNEVQTVTTLADGSFSLLLSEVTPFVATMFDQDNIYLQVEVKLNGAPDTDYEFVDINLSDATDDRKIIASVPFAFNANKLDYKELGFGADAIPYLDGAGELPNSVLPDIQAADLDLVDITLADFTNDMALTSGNILVGDGTNVAVGVVASGDVTLDNTGVFTIADDAVDGTDISLAGEITGDTMYFDGTDWVRLGIGTAGQVLTTNAGATAPEWTTAASGDLAGLNDTNVTAPTAGNILAYDAVNGEWDNVAVSGDGTISETGVFDLADDAVEAAELATDAVGDDAIDYTNVTLADFTNDAGYLTSDTLDGLTCLAGEIAKWNGAAWVCGADDGGASFTASDGITLTGSNFTNDFSTSIESSEITDGTIAGVDLNFSDITLADFTNDAGFLTAESQDLSLLGTNLSITGGSTIDLSVIDTDTDTTYTAGTGLTLVGTEFSADLGADITSAEIVDGAIVAGDLNLTDITLADFTNDVGFLTTVDISDNTNLMAGAGITLTGDMITADLGASVGVTEIELNAVGDAAIDYSEVTLADFTNDAGFLSTVDVSDDTNLTAGTGATLTGDEISVNVGDTIETGEITDGTITAADLNLTDITLADFTNDPGYLTADTLDGLTCALNEIAKWDGAAWVCSPDAGGVVYTASDGITLTAGNFTNDFGTTIESNEITDGTVGDQDLNLTDITLADFTNDAGFVTTDTLDDLTCATDEVAQWDGAAWVCAGGTQNITEVLGARHPRAIFEADGTNNTGSMFEEEEATTGGIVDTILRWFSRQTVLNDYDLVLLWNVPEDFNSFQTPALSLDYRTDGAATDAVIDMTVEHNNDAADEILAAGIGLNANTWTNTTFTLDGTTTWAAGDTLKIRIRMQAKGSNSVRLGNIKINYIENQIQ